MYQQTDCQTVIIDNGMWRVRAGLATDREPQFSFSPAEIAQSVLSSSECPQPGAPSWESMEANWHRVFNRLSVLSTDVGVVISNSAIATKSSKENTAEIFFEKFRTPGLKIIPSPRLSLYSLGLEFGVVVDMGWGATECTAVNEWFLAVPQRVLGGGHSVTKSLRSMLHQRHNITFDYDTVNLLKETYCRTAKRLVVQRLIDEDSVIMMSKHLNGKSYLDLLPRDVLLDSLRYYVCEPAVHALRPSDDFELGTSISHHCQFSGKSIDFSRELYTATESLFPPELNAALHKLFVSDFYNIDKEKLTKNVIVTGGGSCIPGIAQRVCEVFTTAVSTTSIPNVFTVRPPIHYPPSSQVCDTAISQCSYFHSSCRLRTDFHSFYPVTHPDGALSVWKGAAKWASISEHGQYLSSIEEYNESGPSIVVPRGCWGAPSKW